MIHGALVDIFAMGSIPHVPSVTFARVASIMVHTRGVVMATMYRTILCSAFINVLTVCSISCESIFTHAQMGTVEVVTMSVHMATVH